VGKSKADLYRGNWVCICQQPVGRFHKFNAFVGNLRINFAIFCTGVGELLNEVNLKHNEEMKIWFHLITFPGSSVKWLLNYFIYEGIDDRLLHCWWSVDRSWRIDNYFLCL